MTDTSPSRPLRRGIPLLAALPLLLLLPGYFHAVPGSVVRSARWLGVLALPPVIDRVLARRGARISTDAVWRWLPVGLAGSIALISVVSVMLG